jgi:hypothetical protein
MAQLRVGETHTPSEEGEGRADFRGLTIHGSGLRLVTRQRQRGAAAYTSCRLILRPRARGRPFSETNPMQGPAF